MKAIGYIASVVIGFLLCLVILELPNQGPSISSLRGKELANALPHLFFRSDQCAAPSPEDIREMQLTLNALSSRLLPLQIGAGKQFSQGFFKFKDRRSIHVCEPEYILAEVSAHYLEKGILSKQGVVLEDIKLIERLPRLPAKTIELLAYHAFSNEPILGGPLKRDIRPYAMYTLATKTEVGADYGKIAFERMSNISSLGTGAAQVAVAADYPAAIERTSELMRGILNKYGASQTISHNDKFRLYELAYALSFSEDVSPEQLKPIFDFLNHNAQSYAGQFGVLERPPLRLCQIPMRRNNAKQWKIDNLDICRGISTYDR